MITASITDPELFRITDGDENKVYYGCDQEWYPSRLQRMSGCGPTTVCNAMIYLTYNNKQDAGISKDQLIRLMQEVWKYVTPKAMGIHTVELLRDGALAFFKSRLIDVRYGSMDIPHAKSRRPDFGQVISFLSKALSSDSPVAFLNLCNGEVHSLDSWHWVTVISLDYEADGSAAVTRILDEGEIKSVDLKLWYESTKRGGGFIYFYI